MHKPWQCHSCTAQRFASANCVPASQYWHQLGCVLPVACCTTVLLYAIFEEHPPPRKMINNRYIGTAASPSVSLPSDFVSSRGLVAFAAFVEPFVCGCVRKVLAETVSLEVSAVCAPLRAVVTSGEDYNPEEVKSAGTPHQDRAPSGPARLHCDHH